MTSLQQWGGVLALVAIVIAIGAYAYPKTQSAGLVGSSTACTDGYTCVTNLETQGNQIVDGTTSLVGAVSLTGALTLTATTTTGNINMTTSNTATSSLQVGCIQTYATSTATPISLSFYATSSINGASFPTSSNGKTPAGLTVFTYGKCPGV